MWVCMWMCGCEFISWCDFFYRLRGRGHTLEIGTIQGLEKSNDDDNASVISVDINEGTGYSTTWGPVGFSRAQHAFAIMVSFGR